MGGLIFFILLSSVTFGLPNIPYKKYKGKQGKGNKKVDILLLLIALIWTVLVLSISSFNVFQTVILGVALLMIIINLTLRFLSPSEREVSQIEKSKEGL
ncbi:MAG: hypothetical protein FWF14_02725 [Streptococcaceae bacterium]|nr:hypothetical protein [Streptococcaceae bacterium]